MKWINSEQDHHYNDYEYFRRLQDLELLPLKYKFDINDIIFFHKNFHNICTVSFPKYLKVVEQPDLDSCNLRKKISPPDYLGAPIQNSLGEMRSKILDLWSIKCTIEIHKVVFE